MSNNQILARAGEPHDTARDTHYALNAIAFNVIAFNVIALTDNQSDAMNFSSTQPSKSKRAMATALTRAMFAIGIGISTGSTYAQTLPATPAESMTQRENTLYAEQALEAARTKALSRQRLEASLELLESETSRNRNLDRPQSPSDRFMKDLGLSPLPPAKPSATNDAKTNPPTSNADPAQTQDIYERIELLRKIYRQRRADKKPKEPTPTRPAEPAMRQVSTAPAPEPANTKPKPNSIAGSQSKKSPAADPETPITATPLPTTPASERVLANPVDAFEMGNSLFQTGRLETALRAYESVDQSKITAFDSTWLEFMSATCKRRMGNTDEAVASYRRIANEKNSSSLVKASRWWLKHLDNAEKNKAAFQAMEATIESLTERVNSYGE